MARTLTDQPPGPAGLTFSKVGQNLYRLEATGKYYALLERGGKQFRRSLKPTDRTLAERRLADLRLEIGNPSLTEGANVSFAARPMADNVVALSIEAVG